MDRRRKAPQYTDPSEVIFAIVGVICMTILVLSVLGLL